MYHLYEKYAYNNGGNRLVKVSDTIDDMVAYLWGRVVENYKLYKVEEIEITTNLTELQNREKK